MEEQLPHKIILTIDDAMGEKYVQMAGEVLKVDRQIDEKNVRKYIEVRQGGINITFAARQLKLLRSCITGFLRHLHLVVQTINNFKDEEK